MSTRKLSLPHSTGVLALGASLLFSLSATAYAHGDSPYYDSNGQHQRAEVRSEKAHKHDEKHALQDHQREERYYNGNSAALRDHERQEWHALKHHQHDEKDFRKQHQRAERSNYGSNGYGGYGSRYNNGYRNGNSYSSNEGDGYYPNTGAYSGHDSVYDHD